MRIEETFNKEQREFAELLKSRDIDYSVEIGEVCLWFETHSTSFYITPEMVKKLAESGGDILVKYDCVDFFLPATVQQLYLAQNNELQF